MTFSAQYLSDLSLALTAFPHQDFEKMMTVMHEAFDTGRRIFTMGNGGSSATASHWANDINKGCIGSDGKRFKMLCLNDNISTMLAYANDMSYEDVFVEQLKNFFEPGDVVIGISGSGNSENVLRAIAFANENGGKTVGLCGYGGGKLKTMVDIALHADVNDMQKVEDIHVIIVHMSMQYFDAALSGSDA